MLVVIYFILLHQSLLGLMMHLLKEATLFTDEMIYVLYDDD